MLESQPVHPLVDEVRRSRAFAVIRTESAATAELASLACARGGIRFIELTLTTPDALTVVRNLSQADKVIVGVGSVMTVEDIDAAAKAGARFAVSPHYDSEILLAAKRAGLMVAMGGLTPTELMRAHRAGADITKIFPGSVVGPSFIKAVREPMPFLRLMPTGGVDETNILEWLKAGAIAAGLGGSLVSKDAVKAGDWAAVEKKARSLASLLSQ